jgi:hypothetical protein
MAVINLYDGKIVYIICPPCYYKDLLIQQHIMQVMLVTKRQEGLRQRQVGKLFQRQVLPKTTDYGFT